MPGFRSGAGTGASGGRTSSFGYTRPTSVRRAAVSGGPAPAAMTNKSASCRFTPNHPACKSGGGGGGGGAAPPPPSQVKTQIPGEIGFAVGGLKGLLAGGPEEQRSIDRLGSSIRDFTGRGRQALTANQARRGVTGTGVAGRQFGRLEDEANRQFAAGASAIEMDRLDKRQSVLRDILGAGSTKANITNAGNSLGLSLYNTQLAAWQAEQENMRANKAAQLAELSSIFGLMGGLPMPM